MQWVESVEALLREPTIVEKTKQVGDELMRQAVARPRPVLAHVLK